MHFNFIKIFILILLIFSCSKKNNYNKIGKEQIKIDSFYLADSKIQSFIKPYKKAVQDSLSQVLCYSLKSHSKSDSELNSAIGNMMADAVFEIASPLFKKNYNINADFVLLNFGGIRSGLPSGEITIETVYKIMPFENTVVIAKMKSQEIKNMINYLISEPKAHPISGIKIEINRENELKKFKIQNKPLIANRDYFVLTSDYLVKGGDNMNFFKKSDSIFTLELKIRDILIDFFSKKDSLDIKSDNRFIYSN